MKYNENLSSKAIFGLLNRKIKINMFTVHPFETRSDTARLLFMVDSKYFPALKSQKNISPCPVPIVKILPLNETERIPLAPFRDAMFLIFCKRF